jgi:hypothetical protein
VRIRCTNTIRCYPLSFPSLSMDGVGKLVLLPAGVFPCTKTGSNPCAGLMGRSFDLSYRSVPYRQFLCLFEYVYILSVSTPVNCEQLHDPPLANVSKVTVLTRSWVLRQAPWSGKRNNRRDARQRQAQFQCDVENGTVMFSYQT